MYQELKNKAITNISTINAYQQQLTNINFNIEQLNNSNKKLKDELDLLTQSRTGFQIGICLLHLR